MERPTYNLSDRGLHLEIAKAVVHAIQGNPENTLAIYRNLKERYASWYARARIIEIPLLIGERDEAQRDAERWLSSTKGHPHERYFEDERLRIVAQMHVPKLEPDASPNQVFAYKTLAGLIKLASGEWNGARRDFQTAVNTPTTNLYREWLPIYLKYTTVMAERETRVSQDEGLEQTMRNAPSTQ